MAHWTDAAVTNDGVAMLNEWMAGRTIKVVSAYGGTGTVDVEELAAQTGLADPRQTLRLLGEENGTDGKTVQVQLSNAEVTEEYELNQVGVFALLDPGRETETEPKLLFIMQDEKGVAIPSNVDGSFLLELYCLIGITNNGRFQVSVDAAGVATVAGVRTAIEKNSEELREFFTSAIKEELDKFTASILAGSISAPLETSAGEAITAQDGEEIRAHGKIGGSADNDRSYTDMAVSAAAATMTRMVENGYIAVR